MSAADISLDRMVNAVENVRRRLLRATGALKSAGIPYAVVGGNAVAAWVSSVDPGAVRNTRDVDLLVRRQDVPAVKKALEGVGFIHWNAPGFDAFRDGPDGKPSEGIHLLFSGERVWADDLLPHPDISESEDAPDFRVISLEALVRIKLMAFRDKDRTHLRDMIGVGLLDSRWLAKLPVELATRLKQLLDTPNG